MMVDDWYVKGLSKIRKLDWPEVGPKAAHLGELWFLGMPVPMGFCVTVTAFDEFVRATGILDDLLKLDMATWDGLPDIQKQMRTSEIPEQIRQSIASAYRQLAEMNSQTNTPGVAVRSSAVVEDLPDASFAGQFDTFLAVHSVDDVLARVLDCWASLFTERAILYSRRKQLDLPRAQMAVIVQLMVDSEKSGVMFTVNPVTGSEDEAAIESTWGLGITVVSGLVNPDTFIVRRSDRAIISRNISKKNWATIVRPNALGGTRLQKIPINEEKGSSPSLTDVEVVCLVNLGIQIERLLGSPQDVEWSAKNDVFYVLQSRPITNLKAR